MVGIADVLLLDRMVSAVEKVRERLLRAANALDQAGVPYAVIGGNAVMLWVEHHGEGGERNTPNVDLFVNRTDLAGVKASLESAGFAPDVARPDLFLDGPNGNPRTRVRLVFAGEKVREMELLANPAVACSERVGSIKTLSLAALLQVKLTAFRTIDKVHLRDMLDVELIDESWASRYPPELAERLQLLIDTPES